jgi:hypothetical protein
MEGGVVRPASPRFASGIARPVFQQLYNKNKEGVMQQIRRSTVFIILSLITAFILQACGGGGGGGTAAPDLSPAADTFPATSVTSNGCVLNAVVNPKGLSTTAWFEYGTDSTLTTNTTTALQTLGSGSTDNAITQTLTGLNSGTTYYFRVTATNSGGTKKGSIFTVNTLPLPTVTTSAATSITTTGAVLNAIVNPNGRQTNSWFEYGETTALGTSIDNVNQGSGTDNIAVSYSLGSLKVATTYYYRIVAVNSSGTANGTILSFTTAGGVPTVTTKAATAITAHGATLNADVNPNALTTYAWFEYGTTPSLGTVFDNTLRGSGSAVVPISTPLTGLLLNTPYYYRIVASNSVGTSSGDIYNFTTLNPPPTANAGPDNTVYIAGPFGDLGYFGRTEVTLQGSGTVDSGKSIASYLWEQTSGTTVTLDNPAALDPSFFAPALAYGQSEVLQFKLTVTDNTGLTATDNVAITVNWGYLDDFSSDSTGTYNTDQTLGSNAVFIYDATGKRGRVTTGSGEGIIFRKELKIVLPGPDTQLYTNRGIFSLVFSPSSQYGSGGNIWIRLMDTPSTYYEFSTLNNWFRKVRAGVVVDTVDFTTNYSQGGTYPIRVTFSPTFATVEAFGTTASLTTDDVSQGVIYFEVQADQQNGYFDDVKLEAIP